MASLLKPQVGRCIILYHLTPCWKREWNKIVKGWIICKFGLELIQEIILFWLFDLRLKCMKSFHISICYIEYTENCGLSSFIYLPISTLACYNTPSFKDICEYMEICLKAWLHYFITLKSLWAYGVLNGFDFWVLTVGWCNSMTRIRWCGWYLCITFQGSLEFYKP